MDYTAKIVSSLRTASASETSETILTSEHQSYYIRQIIELITTSSMERDTMKAFGSFGKWSVPPYRNSRSCEVWRSRKNASDGPVSLNFFGLTTKAGICQSCDIATSRSAKHAFEEC